jgi:crossover junction endodeoxyribonuclease RuvC
MIIGIDPGISGAIAYIADDYVDTADMPIMTKSSGKGNQVDPYTLHSLLTTFVRQGRKIERAYVESVHAMPGQGVSSVFSFGKSAGIIEGILAAEKIPMVLVTPQKWKKRAGIIGKEKDAARTLALQLYPQIASHLDRKKDVGRADALLIAHFGRQE